MQRQMKRKYVSKTNKFKKKTKVINNLRSKGVMERPLGTTLPAHLKYSDRITITPTALGALASYRYRLSSIHDPDLTGVGRQPLGHDQVATLFERYQVWKVDFKLQFINEDPSNVMRVGYRISDDATSNTTDYLNWEQGLGEWQLLSIAGGGTPKASFSGSVKLNDIHGISYKQYMSNDDYGATFGANPVEEGYLFVIADGLGVDTGNVIACIDLVYHTKLMGSTLTSGS